MSFEEFDRSEIEETRKKFAKEAKERWGGTDAYKESERRTSSYTRDDWERIHEEAEKLYRAFAENMKKPPDDPDVEALVKEWQAFLTRNFYLCTDEILAGLGKMYSGDPRFAENIDKHGQGLADFMSRAIAAYCGKANH